MSYVHGDKFFGGFGPEDGSIDFYSRVNSVLSKDMVVLDLGAGRGVWFEDANCQYRRDLQSLKNKVSKLIAVDVDEAVLNNKSAHECLVMNGNRIPLDDSSVDLIVADFVLEHVQDGALFAKEVDRVLKKGGYFCARTPYKWHYVAVIARVIKNSKHSTILKFIQPSRKEIDIFPTAYLMNTLADIKSFFVGYKNFTFIYRSEPSYYLGKALIYNILHFFHRIAPSSVIGCLFVFLQK